jgi:MFS family permease
MITAGMGFFTDAYDLFIIGTATVLITKQWHLTSAETGLINSMTLISAFVGAFLFGRIADIFGRKRIYGLEAVLMVIGAAASAFSWNFASLIAFRFLLGIGIGGDYPVSAVLMSEYANRKDRGKLVGLVFSMQALGLVAGPIVGLILLSTGMPANIAWRLMLGLGALPALSVVYFRRRMPESPRYESKVKGRVSKAITELTTYSDGAVSLDEVIAEVPRRMGLKAFLANKQYLLYLIGTAGSWFLFDYAYYGNAVSTPLVVKSVLGAGKHPLTETLALSLLVFLIAAVPGYFLAAWLMDRIGHRRLQLIGFPLMGLAFLVIGVVPKLTTVVAPFLIIYGISYFFAEFGPNTTTFVLSAEVFPTSMRTTGHGISAGVAKVGAFIGVYLFPILSKDLGLSGTLIITAVFSAIGFLVTLVLPEPARRAMGEVSAEDSLAPSATLAEASFG